MLAPMQQLSPNRAIDRPPSMRADCGASPGSSVAEIPPAGENLPASADSSASKSPRRYRPSPQKRSASGQTPPGAASPADRAAPRSPWWEDPRSPEDEERDGDFEYEQAVTDYARDDSSDDASEDLDSSMQKLAPSNAAEVQVGARVDMESPRSPADDRDFEYKEVEIDFNLGGSSDEDEDEDLNSSMRKLAASNAAELVPHPRLSPIGFDFDAGDLPVEPPADSPTKRTMGHGNESATMAATDRAAAHGAGAAEMGPHELDQRKQARSRSLQKSVLALQKTVAERSQENADLTSKLGSLRKQARRQEARLQAQVRAD